MLNLFEISKNYKMMLHGVCRRKAKDDEVGGHFLVSLCHHIADGTGGCTAHVGYDPESISAPQGRLGRVYVV